METRKNCCLFSGFLVVLASGFFTSLSHCSFTFTGGILVGHSFQIMRVNEWYECLRACTSNDKCVSYNLISAKFRTFFCELNDCGFANNCEVEQNLIKGSGYIFHQLSNIQLEKTCRKKNLNKMPSEGSIIMAVSCTQRINVYVDENHLSNEMILCPLNSSLTYEIPSNLRVIALEGMDDNRGNPGLMASLGNGVITDDSWKCTDSVENNDWVNVHYNDSMWPHAVVYGNNSSPPWPLYTVSGIVESAKWIWAGNFDVTRHVYCRKNVVEAINLTPESKLRDVKQEK